MAYHISSGIISSGITLYYDSMYISSGGVANSTTVSNYGWMYISSGGTANNTVNSDYMCISSGGVANSTTVNYGGGMYIYGTANSTTVYSGGYMFIYGTANSTTVNSGGNMEISSGGTANNTVNSGGYMYISSGGTATNIVWTPCIGYISAAAGAYVTYAGNHSAVYFGSNNQLLSHTTTMTGKVLSGHSMYVMSGGVANSTTINSQGSMCIFSGGTANRTTVNSRGIMYIHSGGTANSTTVNVWGWMYISSGGTANNTVNSDYMCILSGGVANSTTVNYGGGMYIYGTANSTTVNSGGGMYIYGTANSTTVNSGGNMEISSGGVANSTTVNSGAMRIYSGGTANSTTVNHWGNMYISSGGVANSTTVYGFGVMTISSGGVANSTTVNYGGGIEIYGTANSTTINYGGDMVVNSGCANSTTVNSGGRIRVFTNGTVSKLTLKSGGILGGFSFGENKYFENIQSGSATVSSNVNIVVSNMIITSGTANNITIHEDGSMSISSGIAANNTTMSGGAMSISSGGVANSTIVSKGLMTIYSGGTATAIKENGGYVEVANGANVTFASNTFSGVTLAGNSMTVHKNTVANNVFVANSGAMYIYSGGIANRTTAIGNGGFLHIFSGGIANNTCLDNTLNMNIYKGGSVNSTIASGGIINLAGTMHDTDLENTSMTISSGGIHRGSLQMTTDTSVSVLYGGIIDFWLADRTTADGYMINELRLISGAPTYTITVSATQYSGTYKLAQGAYNLENTISIGDGTAIYGTLTVNGADLTRNGVTYSLDSSGGNLTLTVTGGPIAPTISDLRASAEGISWTGSASAFVTECSKNNFASVIRLETTTSKIDTYQMGAGAWQVRVKEDDETAFNAQDTFTASSLPGTPAVIFSDTDGDLDVFFARTSGTWTSRNVARHAGTLNGWRGTNERVALTGKNIITDVFAGSTDANVLILTDDTNGDVLFLDDVFTALGNQARLSNIDEIRAGAGNDVIDLTSPKFAYVGDNMTVFGGAGDDTIWANSGVNTLYGDAGNDRLVGGNGNDFIIGGAGNDSMHGGGGNDTFCFGDTWGTDTVEQLASGKVILRFETGSMSNWNTATGVYSDGINTVTVTGTNDIELYFGADSTLPAGAFLSASSDKIFEDINSGMLA